MWGKGMNSKDSMIRDKGSMSVHIDRPPATPESTPSLNKGSGHYLLLALCLFFLFAACANLAIILHELGHFVACLVFQLKVTEIKLRPFSASFVSADMGNSAPWKHIVYHGAGIVLGTIFVLPLFLARKMAQCGSIVWLVATATIAIEMVLNAAYLLLGAVMPFGDAQGMVVYGVPRLVLIVIGVPLLLVFAHFGRAIIIGLGLRHEDGLGRWLLVGLGIPAYFPLMVAYTAVVRPQVLSEFPKHLAMMVVLTAIVLGTVAWAFKTSRDCQAIVQPRPIVTTAVILFGLACVVIGGELLFTS